MRQAKEGYRVHRSHWRDWPQILRRVLKGNPPQAEREFYRIAGLQDSIEDQGWTPKYVLLVSLRMSWSLRPGQRRHFKEARQTVVALYPKQRRPPKSYQGFVKALRRLGVDSLRAMLVALRSEFPDLVGEAWEVCGWVPLAVDGSRVEVPR